MSKVQVVNELWQFMREVFLGLTPQALRYRVLRTLINLLRRL